MAALEPDAGVHLREKHNRWVLFDGDNTLWHIEGLYDDARSKLIRYIDPSGTRALDIETFQRTEDKRLFRSLGYSATRFATSFQNTLQRFSPGAASADIAHVKSLAGSVFEQVAPVDQDTFHVLNSLRGTHHLALVTAGEQWVQQRRVDAFPYREMFDVIRIVERKSTVVFRHLAIELSISVEDSWVVGDSLRSDVMPALAAGLNAILIANHNWIEVERDEQRPHNLHVVDRLGDALSIIAEPALEIPAPTHS